MTTSFLVGTSGKLPCSGNVLIFLVMVGSSLLPCLQFSSVSLIRFSRPTYTVNRDLKIRGRGARTATGVPTGVDEED